MSDDPNDPGFSGQRPSVTVRGEAAIRTEPDEALVFVTLAKTKSAPGPALAEVAKGAEQLVVLLDEIGIAKKDRSTTGITVEEEFEHTSEGRRSVGHRATTGVSVRITEMERIGVLILRCSDELDARIAGPRWHVSVNNPARLEAASQAAANARDKAGAYARGLGLSVGAVRTLAEPGDVLSGRPKRSSASFTVAAAGGDMPIETGEQEVVSAVDVTFELIQPA